MLCSFLRNLVTNWQATKLNHVASGPDRQPSARRLVDILIVGSRPARRPGNLPDFRQLGNNFPSQLRRRENYLKTGIHSNPRANEVLGCTLDRTGTEEALSEQEGAFP
jgi:hypothetical protein